MPVSLRAPETARSTAHGRTGSGAYRAARSVAGTPAAKASSRASSYSSDASVAAHQTRRSPRFRRKWSQSPDQAGFRSPGTVFASPARRPDTEPVEEPMNTTGCDGSQNRFSRSWRSFDTGRAPSRRRSGTRSSHLPISERSSGADGTGAWSSTDEDAGRLVPDLAAPLDGTVGHEADLAEEGGGAAVVGHRVIHTLVAGGDRSGAATAVADHGAYRLTIMPNLTQEREPVPSEASVARRPWRRPAAVAGLVAGVALVAVVVVGTVMGGLSGRPIAAVSPTSSPAAAVSPAGSLSPAAISSPGPTASPTVAPPPSQSPTGSLQPGTAVARADATASNPASPGADAIRIHPGLARPRIHGGHARRWRRGSMRACRHSSSARGSRGSPLRSCGTTGAAGPAPWAARTSRAAGR